MATMSSQSSSSRGTPSLTFPRPIFAAVSPHPFLQAHLSASESNASQKPRRANGRTTHEFRAPGVNTGSLTHCNGSAVLRLENTTVVTGVRAEILKEEDISNTNDFLKKASTSPEGGDDDEVDDREEVESLRLLVPNVELATGSTPQLLPGSAPSAFAQTLVTRIHSLLHSTRLVRASDLRILYTPPSAGAGDENEAGVEKQLKGYWVLYIDIFFISIDGNAFDAAWLSLLAALRDTIIPRAFWDEEYETILCEDENYGASPLHLRGLPIPCTFAVLEGKGQGVGEGNDEAESSWVLSDPDAFEESVCSESLCVAVDCSDDKKGLKQSFIRKIEKNGGGVVDRNLMKGLMSRAMDRWDEVQRALSIKS